MSEPVTWKPRSFSRPATGAMAEPAIPRRWMCSAFFSVRVKSLFLKKKSKTPAGGQRYEKQRQKRQEHVSVAKIISSRLAPEFRACLRHRPIDAPERPKEASASVEKCARSARRTRWELLVALGCAARHLSRSRSPARDCSRENLRGRYLQFYGISRLASGASRLCPPATASWRGLRESESRRVYRVPTEFRSSFRTDSGSRREVCRRLNRP